MPNSRAVRVYHGSFMAVDAPKILKSRFSKDFGEGFYCTELEKQAVRWASRYSTPTVSIYEYVPSATLKTRVFSEMTEEWLDFIVSCRGGRRHDFDIFIGAMANDQIYNYIADFIDGVLTREQFWVLAKFKHPARQICLASEEALETLRFVGIKSLGKS